nr:bifunctional UDP-N-acetylglucosamine diphosphorylase/glucosamine-1-phosphate N-acetyltransferase GlmU [Paenibacillus turpanensis]
MAIVLAAGQGKRMKSKLYKVLHPVCGKPMVGHVADVLDAIGVSKKVFVVGHGAEAVQSYLGDRGQYVLQEQQLGTGHAAKQAEDILGGEQGITLVVCGDTPLFTKQSLEAMIALHKETGAAATLFSAELGNPHGYGRVIRDASGAVTGIVEQKDCTPEQTRIREVNAGTYCFDNAKLFAALAKVTNQNAQGEYYLTDVIGILKQEGETVQAYCTDQPEETIGVNDRVALAEAERIMRQRIVHSLLVEGVTFIDPASSYIEADVKIGSDTVIWPGTVVRGKTVIGEDCVIGPNTEITNSVIGDGVSIKQSVLSEAEVGPESTVGPFAYLRPGAKLGRGVKIGDFVEIKNAVLDEGTKVSHLSYVGDAKVGKNVNIGCGAITVNYDGFNKHITEIGDDAFVGSNVNLIAPVRVGRGAYVVAGSTINKDVPEDDLAIARERQTNKTGYAVKIRQKFAAMKKNN